MIEGDSSARVGGRLVEEEGKPDSAGCSHGGSGGPGCLSSLGKRSLDALRCSSLGKGVVCTGRGGEVARDDCDGSGVCPDGFGKKAAAATLTGSGGETSQVPQGVVIEVGIDNCGREWRGG